MADRRWIKIGAGKGIGIVSIIGLFLFLITNYNFEITDLTGDFSCEGTYDNPCISMFQVKNPTKNIVDIYSKDQIKLDFSPTVKDYALFVKDGRCSANGKCRCELKNGELYGIKGWRCVDFTNKTKPLKDKVYNFRFDKYSTTIFKLVAIKYNPSDTIKWGFGVTNLSYLDPIWYGVSANLTYSVNSLLDGNISQNFAPNWTSIVAQINESGNYSWNYSEYNISTYPAVNYTYYFLNNDTDSNFTLAMGLNDTRLNNFEIWVWDNGTKMWNITNSSYTDLFNLTINESKYVNVTLDLINISQTYTNFSISQNNANWSFDIIFNLTQY